MTNNMITTANYTYSSQMSGYPVTNILNTNRDKIWKPAGYFLINSSNEKIYINDGADKTATITNSGYTSPTAFATAVTTALNVVSSNWTCSYNDVAGSYKFKLTRSSGTAVLRQTQTTSAAWDTLGYKGATDISGSPFTADEQRNHTSEFLQIDLGVQTEVGFFAAIGPLDEIFGLSAAGTLKVMGNNVNDWTSPGYTKTLTASAKGLIANFDDTVNTYYRFWRFEYIDRMNGLGPEGISIGHIYIGGYETITSSNVQRGLSRQIIDPSIKNDSESGKRYFDTRPRYEEFSDISIVNMTAADKDIVEQIGYDYGLRTPLFVSFDPALRISTDETEYTRFLYFINMPRVNHLFKDYYAMSMAFAEAL